MDTFIHYKPLYIVVTTHITSSGNNIYWLTNARKPFETKGFRAFYVLVKMPLQHFCNTQCENYRKEWLQVAIKFI